MKRILVVALVVFLAFPLFSDLAKYVPSSLHIYSEAKNLQYAVDYSGKKDFRFLDTLQKANIDTTKPIAYYYLSLPDSYGLTAYLKSRNLPEDFVSSQAEEYQGIKILSVKTPWKGLRYALRYKHLLILTSDIPTAREIIKVIREGGSLSQRKEYQKALKEYGGGAFIAFVDLKALIKNFSPFLGLISQGISQKSTDALTGLIAKVNIKRAQEKLKELDYVFLNINLGKEGILVKKVVYFQKLQALPAQKLNYFSFLPAESILGVDFIVDFQDAEEINNFYQELEKEGASLSQEDKEKLTEMKKATLEFWGKIKEAIYPEIGLSASMEDEGGPSVLVVGKVKKEDILKELINPQAIFSLSNFPADKLQLQKLPETDYLGEKIKGYEITLPEKSAQAIQKIKVFLILDNKFFLLSVGKDDTAIKNGYKIIKKGGKSLNDAPQVAYIFKSLPSKVSAKIYFSPARIIAMVAKQPFPPKGLGGVIYAKDNKVITEIKWDKEMLSSILAISKK
ncbi:MAG: DUF3352 domain-containing protein [Caldiserica bacterium]|nr:DUF3352 domain-containing protein [Caldisericota bacterium]